MMTRNLRLGVFLVLGWCGGLSAADAPAVKLTHDWPSYSGPGGLLAGKCDVPVLDDLSRSKLVWVSEQEDLGFAKTTSGGGHCYPKTMKPSGCGSPIVAEGLVVLGYFRLKDEVVADDVVVAIDAGTGKTRWKQVYAGLGINRGDRKHPRYGPIPVAAGGKVFHLGTTGLVYALDLATGKPLWQADVGQYHKDILAILKRTEGQGAAERLAEIDKWWPYATRAPLQVIDGVLLVPFGPWVAKDKHNPPRTPEENEARKRATLFAFDAASGKPLWKLVDGTAEGNNACEVKLGGATYALTTSRFGQMRLIRPRTGEVVWQEDLGVSHGMQPLVADGRAFVMRSRDPRGPKQDTIDQEPFLAAYTLAEAGPKLAWLSKHPFRGETAWTAMAYRGGVIYAGLMSREKGAVHAIKADSGEVVGACAGGHWLFHLWGDRLIIPGDVNHESMGFPCTYTAVTTDLKDLKLSGKPFAFRHQPPYKGVCGYEVLMHHPFVDGFLFTRAVDTAKGVGVVLCWNLRG